MAAMTIRTNTKMTMAVVERDMSIIESIVLLGQGFEGNPASRQARVHLDVSPECHAQSAAVDSTFGG